MADWKTRALSVAGKVVLIKSNLASIPQCPMNWFKLAKYICWDIDSLNRNFFRKDNCDTTRSRHRLETPASDKISVPKCDGGLGIKDE